MAMAGFFLALAIALVLWINGIISRNQRTQLVSSVLSQTETVAMLVDQALEDMTQSMTQVMWNSEMIHYMIAPSTAQDENPLETSSRDYRIIRLLQSLRDSNRLVKSVAFYSPLSRSVYRDSEYSVRRGSTVSEWYIMEKELGDTGVQLFEEDEEQHTETLLYTRSGAMYLIQRLDIGNHIGTLLCEVDREVLAEMIREAGGTLDIYPYDSFGVQLLRGEVDYNGMTMITDTDGYLTWEKLSRLSGSTEGYCYYKSEKSGWQYLTAMTGLSAEVSAKIVAASYLPLLFVLCMASAAMAAYIREVIYRPINRLMNLVGGSNSGQSQDEFDYLEAAYSDIQGRQEYLAGALSRLAPDMLEILLRHIIFGQQRDLEEVRSSLKIIGNPMPVQASYVTQVCRLLPRDEQLMTEKAWGLYYISLQKAVGSLSDENRHVMGLRVNESMLAMTVCFGRELPEAEIKKELNSINGTLQEMTDRLPYEIWMESGRPYGNILGLRNSFEEACERLRYRQYLQQDSAEEAQESTESAQSREKEFGRFYYREQAGTLVQLAAAGETERMEAELTQLVQGIDERSRDTAELLEGGRRLTEELLERLVAYPLSEEDQQRLENAPDGLRADSREQVREKLLSRCRELLEIMGIYARKNQYRYVTQAKEYIHENYSNSDLSLNDVAEHIGISGSYLSELFNEITGEKFTVYLAKYRVEKAKQLQSMTDLTVKEIGFQCGFNSSQNFIRVYKKYTGHTPGKKM